MLMFDEALRKRLEELPLTPAPHILSTEVGPDLVRILGKTRRVHKGGKPVQLRMFDDLIGVVKYNPNQPRDNRGRFTAGGAKGDTFQGGTGPKGQRRYWVYDHEDNLLGTYQSLTGAKNRGLKHSKATGFKATLYDSVGHRETHTVAFEAAFNKPPQWVTDNKGKARWRDTSAEDAIMAQKSNANHDERGRFASADGAKTAQDRVDELSAKLSSLTDASEDIYWGVHQQLENARAELDRRRATTKGFDPGESRDDHGRWTSSAGKEIHNAVVRGKLYSLATRVDTAHDNFRGSLDEVRSTEKSLARYEKELTETTDPDDRENVQDLVDGTKMYLEEKRQQLAADANELGGHVSRLADSATKVRDAINSKTQVAKAFNPDEDRDERGRWTGGNGSPDREVGIALQQVSALRAAYGAMPAGEERNNLGTFISSIRRVAGGRQLAIENGQVLQGREGRRQPIHDVQVYQPGSREHALQEHTWAGDVHTDLVNGSKIADKVKDMDLGEHTGALRQAVSAMKQAAAVRGITKTFNPDETRDNKGKWTADGGISSGDAETVHSTFASHKDAIGEHLDRVHEAHDELDAAAEDAKVAEKEADDEQEANGGHPVDDFEEAAADAQMDAAKGGAQLHDALQKLHDAVGKAKDEVEAKLADLGIRRVGKKNVAKAHNLGKNLTAGDVHATTALGNQRKIKARDFLSTIGEAKVVQMPADVGKSDPEAGTKRIIIIRHGHTSMNNHNDTSQDRIRGWTNVPLNEEGRKDAAKAAKKAKKAGVEVVVSSDLDRAKETAQDVAKEVGTDVITTPKLRPWDLGDFTGKATKDALPKILPYVTDKPDEPVPGGESFNDFSARSMSGLKFAVDKAGDKLPAVVTHYRNERHYVSWEKAGQPADHSIDADEFAKKGGAPGELTELDVNIKRLAGNSANIAKQVEIGLDVIEKAIMGDTDAITYLAEVGKQDSGPINATLMLQPLDTDPNWAKSPYPWDANAKASMRPDQVKPFLGALTDPDELPVKTVLLRTCVAMQDRVDPGKVQSMIDNEPDDLPVIARLGGNGNDARNVIIDGHHRMTARFLMGRKTAQVRFIDLTTPAKANSEAKEEETGSTSDK